LNQNSIQDISECYYIPSTSYITFGIKKILLLKIISIEPPDKPDNVLVSEIDSRSAIITWITPYSGNSIIISYQLEYKTIDNGWDSSDKIVQTIPGSDNSFNIRGLKPISSYDIRIRAENKLGFSVYASTVQFTTTEEGIYLLLILLIYFHILSLTSKHYNKKQTINQNFEP
jgi:hypothetical protein